MTDGTTIGIRANGDPDGFHRPRLILNDGNYRWWRIVLKQMLREKKIWGHVQGKVVEPGPIFTLGAGATPATPAVPAIVAAMGVAVLLCVVVVPANG